jgi:hypothetical protein
MRTAYFAHAMRQNRPANTLTLPLRPPAPPVPATASPATGRHYKRIVIAGAPTIAA